MGNMTYCALENTSGDFEDCLEKLRNIDSLSELSSHELRGFKRIARLLPEFAEEAARLEARARADDRVTVVRVGPDPANYRISSDAQEAENDS